MGAPGVWEVGTPASCVSIQLVMCAGCPVPAVIGKQGVPSQACGSSTSCPRLPVGHGAQRKATVPVTARVTLLLAQVPICEVGGCPASPRRGWALCPVLSPGRLGAPCSELSLLPATHHPRAALASGSGYVQRESSPSQVNSLERNRPLRAMGCVILIFITHISLPCSHSAPATRKAP